MITPIVSHIARLTLNVHDLDRAVGFYVGALGFTVEAMANDRACLAIGLQKIELVQQPHGQPYPVPRAANDPWFQHFAIAVADMDTAYERLSRFSPEPITLGVPQLLPPSTGSVTAYKFRDPDGHPLELSYAPGSIWFHVSASAGAVFLGIDHTALAVHSLEASIAFYTKIGFRLGARSVNQGPEQARLDGIADAVVDIVTLSTPGAGPHIELLHYQSRAPAARHDVASVDIAATQTVLAPLRVADESDGADRAIASQRDPDGHLLRFTIP
ncbi:MAG: glyoxalase [Sphingomonadales bacterium]|nr:glyoxalase [Sphingomonadales bacterium]